MACLRVDLIAWQAEYSSPHVETTLSCRHDSAAISEPFITVTRSDNSTATDPIATELHTAAQPQTDR